MLKKPHYILLGLAVVLTLVVLNLPAHTAARLKLFIGGSFLPLFGLSRAVHQVTAKAGDALVPRGELIRQNEQLRLANDQLQIRITQAEAQQRENDRLRQLLGWKAQSPWKDRLRLGKVIGRDPANWWQTARINLGSIDHLRVDLPVLVSGTGGGYLVGRIQSVNLVDSQVLLVSDPSCRVAAVIDKGRGVYETGVLKGSESRIDKSFITISYLSGNSSLKAGQVVYTSGEGGLIDKGILIGQIAEEPRTIEFGLAEARVKTAVDLSALEEVWVLLPPSP
jgi:rod shape-determining protein MreC